MKVAEWFDDWLKGHECRNSHKEFAAYSIPSPNGPITGGH